MSRAGSRTAPPGTPTVVLVEDDLALVQALRFSLEIEGWAVLCCGSGEALLELALPTAPFCFVCDLRLPGMSGIEALQQLRARGVGQPAIMISGAPSDAQRQAATTAGAIFVEKPLVDRELLDAIRDALA